MLSPFDRLWKWDIKKWSISSKAHHWEVKQGWEPRPASWMSRPRFFLLCYKSSFCLVPIGWPDDAHIRNLGNPGRLTSVLPLFKQLMWNIVTFLNTVIRFLALGSTSFFLPDHSNVNPLSYCLKNIPLCNIRHCHQCPISQRAHLLSWGGI